MKRDPDGANRPGREPEIVEVAFDGDVDERLDSLLASSSRLSRSRIAALIDEGRVTVDGAVVQKSYRPRAGDHVRMEVPPPPTSDLLAEDIPLDVVYEDADLVVVDKPHGMVVHPAPGHPSGTLVNALLGRYGSLSSVGLPLRPGIVHRLDRDTSGLMLVARDDAAHGRLSAALARREVGRGYLAAVWGRLDPEERTIEGRIGRDPANRKRMALVPEDAPGRPARTHVRRLERWPAADLLAVRLDTGRTHQIRVHLSSLGHPIVGDPLYGAGWERGMSGAGGQWAVRFARRTGRLFLHAARLSFEHPRTGENLSFNSDLPEPLAGALQWARSSA